MSGHHGLLLPAMVAMADSVLTAREAGSRGEHLRHTLHW